MVIAHSPLQVVSKKHRAWQKMAFHRVSIRPPWTAVKRQQFWASADFLWYIWPLLWERNQSGAPLQKGYRALIDQGYYLTFLGSFNYSETLELGWWEGLGAFDLDFFFLPTLFHLGLFAEGKSLIVWNWCVSGSRYQLILLQFVRFLYLRSKYIYVSTLYW